MKLQDPVLLRDSCLIDVQRLCVSIEPHQCRVAILDRARKWRFRRQSIVHGNDDASELSRPQTISSVSRLGSEQNKAAAVEV